MITIISLCYNISFHLFIYFSLFIRMYVFRYIWSVMLGHVEPDFPYISTAGTTPPESCVFGQCLNIVAVTCKYRVIH